MGQTRHLHTGTWNTQTILTIITKHQHTHERSTATTSVLGADRTRGRPIRANRTARGPAADSEEAAPCGPDPAASRS